ncbi:hypothetical protein JHU04_003050 [Brenneria sp. 4F2]|nr:hypothetical protein [Brenneria bubanii]
MTTPELEEKISEALTELDLREKKYKSARATYLSALERDIERSEGSGRQELLHDQYMADLSQESIDTEAAYQLQKQHVKELKKQRSE